MKKPVSPIYIIIAVLFFSTLASFLLSRRQPQQTGNSTASSSALRIVSGYTAFTEILEELGAADRIVAATRSDAKRLDLPSIGSHMRPDLEAVLTAAPDLILFSSRHPENVEALRQRTHETNIRIIAAHPETVEEVLNLIDLLGALTSRQEQANEFITQSRNSLEQVEQSLLNTTHRPTVFLEVRATPSLLTCGTNSIAYDIIQRAGGTPVCTLPGSVVQFSMEALVDQDPDFYLQQHGIMNKTPLVLENHPVLGEMSCIKQKQYTPMEEAILSRPGPGAIETVRTLHNWIYRKER